MNVECPNCKHCFEVKTRAEFGKGTQKGKHTKLNRNRVIIMKVIKDSNKKLSSQDVLTKIKLQNFIRISKKGTGWNYHTIQADLSILVGGSYLQMNTNGSNQYNSESGEFESEILPTYELTIKGKNIMVG